MLLDINIYEIPCAIKITLTLMHFTIHICGGRFESAVNLNILLYIKIQHIYINRI